MHAVAQQWFELARTHYFDASAVDAGANPRSVYSRAYYAAYNASKAVRYVVQGFVSMHGDDHKKVTELPGSFPSVDSWVSKLNLLYQHRLRADYDNWADTIAQNELSPTECLAIASEFLKAAEQFLLADYGVRV